ncbi:hypothetical protein SAMN05444365_101282 [Micromonospora pattaloongensis]|uniref:Uncharacterized protein n=2 Tax=Micromonospora pattaloongensis TaxID=405436 RepID=A0A1H3G4K6_9ACTN|nr:hypothetical protein SAMN05444365_101282 [Micromonospora pattaloongensis]
MIPSELIRARRRMHRRIREVVAERRTAVAQPAGEAETTQELTIDPGTLPTG